LYTETIGGKFSGARGGGFGTTPGAQEIRPRGLKPKLISRLLRGAESAALPRYWTCSGVFHVRMCS
jgi:hypothetical protein